MNAIQQDKISEVRAFREWVRGGGWVTLTLTSMRRVVNAFMSSLGDARARILEIGCGTGQFSDLLSEKAGGSLVCCDLCHEMVEICSMKGLDAHFLTADAEQLPFRSDSFDAVFMMNLLHHFLDQSLLLGEVRRVLKKGGIVFAMDPNRHNPIVYLYRVIFRSRSMLTPNEILLSRKDVKCIFRTAGFERCEVNTRLGIYFTREYYRACLPGFLSFVVYLCNGMEWILMQLPVAKRFFGSFLTTRAYK